MPERWERRLQALADVHAPASLDDRVRRGTSGHDLGPSLQRRVAAAVVAFGVFAAAGAFAWRAFDGEGRGQLAGTANGLPTLSIGFQNAGPEPDSPPDEPWLRVETTIDYGDLHEEDRTSTVTTLQGPVTVDWVAVEDLTHLVPGPAAGSPVEMTSDGEDARVLIGPPGDWPDFDRFERIDRLPDQPGDYVLVFAADYAEGVAMTARLVHLVQPGTMELTLREGGALDAATAAAWVDGTMVPGFLATSSFWRSDVGVSRPTRSPSFQDVDPLRITNGSSVVVAVPPDAATAGLLSPGEEIPDRLPIDLDGGGQITSSEPGVYHLAVDAKWRHGKTGYGTEERAGFLFPVEIVAAGAEQPPSEASAAPSEGGTFAEPTANLLVQTGGPSGDAALLEGSLSIRNGCVGVGSAEQFTYLIWPAGSSLVQQEGALSVIDASGGLVASIGDTIRMGGGVGFLRSAQEAVVGGIPPACQTEGEHYWYVGGVEPVTTPAPDAAEAVTVSDVVGLSVEEALTRIEPLGLVASDLDDVGGDFYDAIVIQQDPAAGTEVDTGTFVYLVIGPNESSYGAPALTHFAESTGRG